MRAIAATILLAATAPWTTTDAFTTSSSSTYLRHTRHPYTFSSFYEPSTSLPTSSSNRHNNNVVLKMTSVDETSASDVASHTDDDDGTPSSIHNNNPLCINMKYSIKPECRDDFLSMILQQQKETLSKETTLQYVVGEDVSTPNTFYIHQQYSGDDAHTPKEVNSDWFTTNDDQPIIEYYYSHHTPQHIPIRSAYCVHVELYINPSVLTEFTSVIQNNSFGSNNNEPLCLQYVYGESTTTPHKFIFHEEYTGDNDGKEGFDAHANAPHFKVWEEFAAKENVFTKDPVVHFFKSIC